MKTDIHPALHPVVFIDSSSKAEFATTSTLTSDKTKKINGVDHYVINVDISSASHPFYTGKQMLIDTAGRVDKFRARQEAAQNMKDQYEASKAKKTAKKKETLEERVTRKAKENTAAKEQAKKDEEEAKAAAKKKVSKPSTVDKKEEE